MQLPERETSQNSMASPLSSTKLDDLFADFKSPGLTPLFARKRKRRDSLTSIDSFDDCTSLSSLDMNALEPPKRRRSLARLTSLTNMLSPVKPMKKVGKVLSKSMSLKNLKSPTNKKQEKKDAGTPYKKPTRTPSKKRQNQYWCDIADGTTISNSTHSQIKRQEAIYELYKSESDMVEDMTMIQQTYKGPLVTLKLLSEEESEKIFGHISALLPLHEELVLSLEKQRLPDGKTEHVGQVLQNWVPTLKAYTEHCCRTVYAKALLDEKKDNSAVLDFLERCQESSFSRKLDLWSFLDLPRSKLVKYPLLLKAIEKATPEGHTDRQLIADATRQLEHIISEVDRTTGEAKCCFIRDKLHFIDDSQKVSVLDQCTSVLCEGVLKNNRGTKLQVYLFDKLLVLSRPVHRNGSLQYQVYRQPIPTDQLVLEDLKDGSIRKGSFRSTFTPTGGQAAKNMFRVAFTDPSKGQAHTLQASDEHDKRQWVSGLQRVAMSIVTTDDFSSKTEHRC